MRRRRHRLEVSTFPFLAVLLCAMGSLILLLLVLDRRAKAVGRAKAEEAARTARLERETAARATADEIARRAADRAAERERQRLAAHDELARAKDDLNGQLQAVEKRQADAAQGVRAARSRWRELLEILGNQRAELAQAEREAAAGNGAAETEQVTEAARREAARLSAQLRGLELVLGELKEARKRDAQTYSLLPYRGRRGDSRRPIYVECTANGLLFHPDRRTLSRIASDAEIREEIELRIEWQRKRVLATGGQPEKRPYLLMLVRPDGIASYYTAVAALQGRQIDFGYEFIDADWVLDFPEDDSAGPTQPWMTARRTAVAPGDPSSPARKVSGLRPGRSGVGDGSGNAEGAVAGGTGPARAQGGSDDLPPLPAELRGAAAGAVSPGPSSGQNSGQSTEYSAPGGGGVAARSPGVVAVSPDRATSDGRMSTLNPPGQRGAAESFGKAGRHGQETVPQQSVGGGSGAKSDLPPLPGSPGGSGWTGGNAGSVAGAHAAVGGPGPGTGGVPGGSGGGGPGVGRSSPGVGGPPDQDGSLRGGPPAQPGAPAVPGQPVALSGQPAAGAGPPGNGSGPGTAGPGGGPGAAVAGAPSQTGGTPGPDGATAGSASPSPGPAAGAHPGSATGAPGAGGGVSPASPPPNPWEERPGPAVADGHPPHGATAGQDPDEPRPPQLDAGKLPGHERAAAGQPPRPPRLIGNRDWVIPVECRADDVVLRNAGQRFAVASLVGPDNALVQSLKQMIARRQASVRPGEPPYRPQVRFLIYPDGLRTYFLTFPTLEQLGITLTRQNVEADAPTPRRKEAQP
jgi:hypothetical protein